MEITAVDIDLAKSIFQISSVDAAKQYCSVSTSLVMNTQSKWSARSQPRHVRMPVKLPGRVYTMPYGQPCSRQPCLAGRC